MNRRCTFDREEGRNRAHYIRDRSGAVEKICTWSASPQRRVNQSRKRKSSVSARHRSRLQGRGRPAPRSGREHRADASVATVCVTAAVAGARPAHDTNARTRKGWEDAVAGKKKVTKYSAPARSLRSNQLRTSQNVRGQARNADSAVPAARKNVSGGARTPASITR